MKRFRLLSVFVLVGFVASGVARATTAYESFRPGMVAGAAYTIDALRLHPTQFSVGQREIEHKRTKFDGMSPAAVTAYLQKKDVPVVIGPGGLPYLTDGHHTISALIACAQPDKTVYGHILANWSDVADAEFWVRMQKQGYTFLNDSSGQHRHPSELPASLVDMKPDSYRGLAWAVMEAGGFEEIKPPAIFFQEFYWAEFFRTRITWNDADEADFARALQEALTLAHSPAAATLPGYKDPQR
ncbi:MAG: ParB/Srx family N-terminal domain-containing protein [Cephaloticoccus sp.]|nr:ParB/Srx family N-terminal domain-containing protein [Cephaloticoccus sp.]MCF7759661.1 ParB/Srx family N-terminal domain-containing protein [Cephaloticoccus sp.]